MINKTQNILNALLQGRKINQWDDYREFQTTRLGGIVFNLRKQGLKIESEIVQKYVGTMPNPPVQYYCTTESIHAYWKSNPVSYDFFKEVELGKFVML